MIRKKIAIIGIGSFGKVLTERLFLEGHEVLAIDKSMEEIESIQNNCTGAVCLDATDEHALRSQGLEDMDVVVISLADNFETLVVCADILKRMGVKEILARYKTELQKKILRLMGIEHIFNPEEKAAINMAESLRHPGIITNLFLSEEYRIADITVPARVVGKTILEIQLHEKHSIHLITIKRKNRSKGAHRPTEEDEEAILGIPSAQEKLHSHDTLLVFGKQADINRFLES